MTRPVLEVLVASFEPLTLELVQKISMVDKYEFDDVKMFSISIPLFSLFRKVFCPKFHTTKILLQHTTAIFLSL